MSVDHTRGSHQEDKIAVRPQPAHRDDWHSDNVVGGNRLRPICRIGRGGAYYHLAQLMKFLNLYLVLSIW